MSLIRVPPEAAHFFLCLGSVALCCVVLLWESLGLIISHTYVPTQVYAFMIPTHISLIFLQF